jgi:uncharacterized protein YndB with AHSA1/START domain
MWDAAITTRSRDEVDEVSMSVTEQIAAAPEVVWAVLVDIDRWPTWTQSVRSAQRLDDGPLAVGSRARLRQPGMPTMVWEVTDLTAPTEFTWRARTPGVATIAVHRMTPASDGGTALTLAVEHAGPLAGLVGALTRSRTRRYIGLEAAGLKQASEARAAG